VNLFVKCIVAQAADDEVDEPQSAFTVEDEA